MNENELTGLLESLRRMGSDDLNVEVKESATTLSRDVWETVSAFANTAGGIIVLGVSERAGFVPVENFETEKYSTNLCQAWVMRAVEESWPIRLNTRSSEWSFRASSFSSLRLRSSIRRQALLCHRAGRPGRQLQAHR